MSYQAKFDKAVAIVQSLPKDGPVKPTQEDQLYFYARYKLATVGKVNTERPGMFDFVGKAKWDEWKAVEEMSKEDAMEQYVKRLLELLKKAGGQDELIAEIEALN